MNIKHPKATIGFLSIIIILIIFGWVLPKYAYVRRLSADKAKDLLEEYRALFFKTYLGVSKDESYKPDEQEATRMLKLRDKLTTAGYTFTMLPMPGDKTPEDVIYILQAPEYAGYTSTRSTELDYAKQLAKK